MLDFNTYHEYTGILSVTAGSINESSLPLHWFVAELYVVPTGQA